MPRIVHTFCALAFVAIGGLHTALTAVFYKTLSEAALWFAGAGLASVVVGFLNVASARHGSQDPLVRWMTVFSNAVLLILIGLAVCVVPEFQTILFLVFAVLLFATSLGVSNPGRKRIERVEIGLGECTIGEE